MTRAEKFFFAWLIVASHQFQIWEQNLYGILFALGALWSLWRDE